MTSKRSATTKTLDGSIQRMNSGRIGSTRSCMEDELIREFHEAGIYDYAQSLGIIQNDTIAIPNGLNVDDNCNSQPWQATGEYSLPALSGIPAMYMGINVCPSVAFDSMESGSICSSSRHSDVMMATLASNNAMAGLNNVDTKGDEFESPGTPVGRRKRRRIHRTTIGEQGGRGLRHFSMKVCKKVESKGWTTYNEVASELVAEFVNPNSTLVSQDQQQYDEKNIRRRVYDALNVLMAMDIITKEKKEIHWKGLPIAHLNDIEQLKADQKEVITRIEKKRAYLQELEEQITGLQNLVLRNKKVHMTGNNPSGGVALPFILVKTRPHATVDIEISEDMQLVHFDFNSTPFELHDDAFVLKAMQFCKTPCTSSVDEKAGNKSEFDNKCSPICTSSCHSTRISDTDSYSLSSIPGKLCNSPPVPVITKAHVKDEDFN